MTTTTVSAPAKLIPVVVYWKGNTIAITAGSQTCKIDQTHFDSVCFDDEEDSEYTRLNKERAGRAEFTSAMTREQLLLWVSMRKKLNEYVPTTVQEAPSPVEPIAPPAPVIVEKPAPSPVVLPSLANYDVKVNVPEVEGSEYVGGPTVQTESAAVKTRRKRGEKMGNFIHEEYRKRTRGWGIDQMEQQITRLQRVVELANQEVSIVVYDIPTDIREMIVDPCNVFHCIGFRYNKSVWVIPTKALESPLMQGVFGLWDNFTDPNDKDSNNTEHNYLHHAGHLPLVKGKRQYIDYGIEEFSAKSLERLRAMAEKDLRAILIDAHGSLIAAIDKADKDLAEALEDEEKTLKEQEKAVCGRANAIRAALVKAGEILRRSVTKAIEYDNTENVKDLLVSYRDAILSQATTFNAAQRLKHEDGVVV